MSGWTVGAIGAHNRPNLPESILGEPRLPSSPKLSLLSRPTDTLSSASAEERERRDRAGLTPSLPHRGGEGRGEEACPLPERPIPFREAE